MRLTFARILPALLTMAAVAGGQRAAVAGPLVVDADGRAVEGCDVSVGPNLGELAPPADNALAKVPHARTDVQGIARLDGGDGQLKRACVYARHEGRKLVAAFSGEANADGPVQIKLTAERQLLVSATCPELANIQRELGPVVAEVRRDGKFLLAIFPDMSSFRLPLSPGRYELTVYGGGYPAWSTSSATHHLTRAVTIEDVDTPQQLDVALVATRLALLEGHRAPELPGIATWKNSPALTMAELRGNVVLLEFWGYWCRPCIMRMPQLMELHDKYHEQGLVVIGVHVDLGADEERTVDSAAELDARLVDIRKLHWHGRDLPFAVAIAPGAATPFGEGVDRKARSPAAAAYGVVAYPTQVLVDRKGNVVRRFLPDAQGIKLLEKTLDEQ